MLIFEVFAMPLSFSAQSRDRDWLLVRCLRLAHKTQNIQNQVNTLHTTDCDEEEA